MPVQHRPGLSNTTPDRVEIRQGGGCCRSSGSPSRGGLHGPDRAGSFRFPTQTSPGLAWPLIFLMGLAFVAVGRQPGFRSAWTPWIQQRDNRQAVGLLVPCGKEQFSALRLRRVRLRFEEGIRTRRSYPVVLQGRGRPEIGAVQPTAYPPPASRANTSPVSCAFRWWMPPRITSRGGPRPGDGELHRAGAALCGHGERAARPPFMRSQVEQFGGKVRIVIPGPGSGPSAVRLRLPAAFLGM